MRRVTLALTVAMLAASAVPAAVEAAGARQSAHSCSTFLLPTTSGPVVGHNLDEDYAVPGVVVINKRGVAKENVTWDDILALSGRIASAPRVQWTSRFASVTYNTFGREFIDGGMNEAGLYVGEMTVLGTRWPRDATPRIYHHQWMQYLLDSFATVEEAVGSLGRLVPSGHCQWHFFIADRGGDAAVVEFIDGSPAIYRGDTLPVAVACNDFYAAEIQKLRRFQGFGGSEDAAMANKQVDNRFAWAAQLVGAWPTSGASDPVRYAFSVLRELDCGNNQWSVVCDLTAGRMYFQTSGARSVRYVDLRWFDPQSAQPAMALDIREDISGDAAPAFSPFTDEWNSQFVDKALKPVDAGFFGNLYKPVWRSHLVSAAKRFTSID